MRALLDALHAARDRDQVGLVLCEAALGCAEACLDGLDTRALRAMVQLRGPAGYEALVVVERDAAPEAALPSTTAWSWLQETGAPLTVNVPGRRLILEDGQVVTLPQARVFGSGVHMSLRGVTHVTALPLRQQGQVVGLLAVEVAAPAKVFDLSFRPLADSPGLAEVADLAAAFLSSARPSAPVPVAGLPVVGEVMSQRLKLLRVFAELDETVLLRGPVGSGKSRLARWVHDHSPRREKPFVAAQLQGLPRDLLAGELFGHRGGVFAGAPKDREGLVQAAEGGTLFLDEVDKLSLDAQAVLLELLETRTWRRLGDNASRESDVRFVVATNADLDRRVAEGLFLEDLQSRIDILAVQVPGLDQRRDEIPGWARYLLAERGGLTLDDGAARALSEASHPQSLRGLKAIVVRAYAHALAAGAQAVGEEHVRAALRPNTAKADTGSLDGAMSALGRRCVLRGPPPFDLGKALVGAVIEEAARDSDLASAFTAVGQEAAVKHRNHRRRHAEYLEALQALRGWLTEP